MPAGRKSNVRKERLIMIIHKKSKLTFILSFILVLILGLSGCESDSDKAEAKNENKEATTAAALDTSDSAVEASTNTAIDDSREKEPAKNKEDDGQSEKDQEKSKPEKSNKKKDKSDKVDNEDSAPESGSGKSNETGGRSNSNDTEEDTITCTIAIDCKTALAKEPEIAEKVSDNGTILSPKQITLKKGATVYDALKASEISFVGSDYIKSINGLSERECGSQSGWKFNVNGVYVLKGCKKAELKSGDSVTWRYTCKNCSDL
jgi:hypothetical protein